MKTASITVLLLLLLTSCNMNIGKLFTLRQQRQPNGAFICESAVVPLTGFPDWSRLAPSLLISAEGVTLSADGLTIDPGRGGAYYVVGSITGTLGAGAGTVAFVGIGVNGLTPAAGGTAGESATWSTTQVDSLSVSSILELADGDEVRLLVATLTGDSLSCYGKLSLFRINK